MPEEKNNIFAFPKNNERMLPPMNQKEADEALQDFQEFYINEALDQLVPNIFQSLFMLGFTSDEKKDEDKCTLVVEALRAFMLYKYNVDHPFHTMAEKIFEENKETGLLQLKRDMSISFKIRKNKKINDNIIANNAMTTKG